MRYIKLIIKYPILFFCLISLIPLFWFDKKLPFAYGDSGLHSIYYFYYQTFKIYRYLWIDQFGSGSFDGVYSILLPLYFIKSLFEILGVSYWLNQFLSLFFSFLISFVFFYFYIKDIFYRHQKKEYIALFSSLFYIFNPFSMFLYIGPLMLNLYILPFTTLILFTTNRYLKTQKKYYIFGFLPLIYFVFSVVFVNPPFILPVLLLVLTMSIYLIYTKHYYDSSISIMKFLLSLLFISLLSNIFWLLPFLTILNSTYSSASTMMNPTDTLAQVSENYSRINSYFRLLPYTFNEYLWIYKQSDWFMWYFKNPIYIYGGYLLFLFIFIYSLLSSKNDNHLKRIFTLLLLVLLISMFLLKGSREPVGSIFVYAIINIPFFGIFRSPINKFGILYIYSICILFGIAISRFIILDKNYRLTSIRKCLLIVILLFIGVYNYPLVTGKIFTDPVKIRGNIITSEVEIPSYYRTIAEWFNTNREISRILVLPLRPSNNVGFKWEFGYDGGDPSFILFKHQTISTINQSNSNSKKILNIANNDGISTVVNLSGLYNIKYIINQKDVDPVYGGYGGLVLKNSSVITKELDQMRTAVSYVKSIGEIDIYKNNNYFLAHVYTPQLLIINNQSIDSLPQLVSQSDYKIRSAIYFSQQIIDNSKQKALEMLPKEIKYTPNLEFKKINPIKYRIIIHKAKEAFPLVFSESYHGGWKGYFVNSNLQLKSQNLDGYKILDGNKDDQAEDDELKDFIDKGWVTTLGDMRNKEIKHMKYENGKEKLDYVEKYKIDFVSKNFQGTIQNNNLANGPIYETWLKKPIDESNHLVVNGYANSWIIDPVKLCGNSSLCTKNPDGSYDMELVVEFWPQRLFYIGLGISGMTLIGCVGYLVWDWRRRLMTT